MIYLVYVILCLIWGSTWVAIKIGLDDAPPFWLASFRFLIGALVMIAVSRIKGDRFPRDMKELGKVAFPGIFMYGASYILVYSSEVYIDSALTAVIFASFPFFIAGFSIAMIPDERLKLTGWLGLIVGFLGIVLIFRDSLMQSEFIFWGALLALLAAVSSAFGTVYIKAYLKEYEITLMSAVQMTVGALIILAAALVFESLGDFRITSKSVFSVLYLALFGTIAAFLGYYWLLKKIKAIHVSLIAFITPLAALGLGNLIRGEAFSLITAFGTALILGGILLVIKK